MKEKVNYKPAICECCNQTTTYLVGIDRGMTNILKKMARAIDKKGINCIHTSKEGVLTHSELCNSTKPCNHGLMAHVEGMPGNFLITRKGFDFLNGESIPKYAIISKAESRQIGYFEPEKYQVKITDFNSSHDYWEGINYEIREGRVVRPTPVPTDRLFAV